MKVFQILLLTAMVAVAMEKCVAEYLLVEIEDVAQTPRECCEASNIPEFCLGLCSPAGAMPRQEKRLTACSKHESVIENCFVAAGFKNQGPKPMPKPTPEPEPEPMPKKEISPSAKCCAERGVPQKCSYACDHISNLATRSIGLCTSYTIIIQTCIEATKLQDCCDHYNVKEKAEDCWDVLCEDKSISCANEPWVFFEQFPKKGCDQHAKNIKSCCKL